MIAPRMIAPGIFALAMWASIGGADAQEPVSDAIGPFDLHQTYLPLWLDADLTVRRFALGTNQSLIVSTRRAGVLQNDYGAWESRGLVTLPFTVGRYSGSFEMIKTSTLAAGSYYDEGNFIRGDAHFGTLAASGTVALSSADRVQLAFDHEELNALLHNSYLSGTFDAFGSDPDAAWRRDDTRLGLDYERQIESNWKVSLATESDVLGASIAAQSPTATQSLSVPAGAVGTSYRVGAQASITGSRKLEIFAKTEDAAGIGSLTRESGLAVGHADTFIRTRGVGGACTQSYDNGGQLRLDYENLAASTEYSGLIYNAVGAGLNASSDTLVGYDTLLKDRRSEIGLRWSTPQGARRKLELGYRQLWLQEIGIGDYAASVFIFGVQGSSAVSYPHAKVGVLNAAYELPVRSLTLRVEAQQLIPYHLQDSTPNLGSGVGNSGPAGPSAVSSGGWTLGAEISYRF